MKRFCSVARTAALGTLVLSQAALAHGPVFDCYLEQDDWVRCEAGFTDGSSAAGRKVHVQDASGCLLYTSPSPRDVEESRMPSSA